MRTNFIEIGLYLTDTEQKFVGTFFKTRCILDIGEVFRSFKTTKIN